MIIAIFVIPILAIISAVLLFKFNGKRSILKFDFVQFIYAFVITPILFVWLKYFLFYILKQELSLRLSLNELFLADTILSVILLYVSFFIVIHSLTKTFNLNRQNDPLYDMVAHSEYLHLNLSHLAIYAGSMFVATLLSLSNLAVPLAIENTRNSFYAIFGFGLLGGIASFMGIWKYDSPDPNFMRIMKLLLAFFFLIHAVAYFWFDPGFNTSYILFWFVFALYMATMFMSLFAERPEKKMKIFRRMPFQINPMKPKYYLAILKRIIYK